MDLVTCITIENATTCSLNQVGECVRNGYYVSYETSESSDNTLEIQVRRLKSRSKWLGVAGVIVFELSGSGHFLVFAWNSPSRLMFTTVSKVSLGIYRHQPEANADFLKELLGKSDSKFERYVCPRSGTIFVMVSSQFFSFSGTISTKKRLLGTLQLVSKRPLVPISPCRVYLLISEPESDSSWDLDEFGNNWQIVCDFNPNQVVVCGAKVCGFSQNVINGTYLTSMKDLKSNLTTQVTRSSIFKVGTIRTSPCELRHITNEIVPLVSFYNQAYQTVWLEDFWDFFNLNHKLILHVRSSDLLDVFKIRSQSALKHFLCGSFAIIEELEVLSDHANCDVDDAEKEDEEKGKEQQPSSFVAPCT